MAKITDVDITSLLFQEGSAPSTPASTKWRLYAKTDGVYYKDDAGAETGPLGASGSAGNLGSARYLRTAGDYTITGAGSDSFANVDGTNLSLTISTGVRPVLIVVNASGTVNNAAGEILMDVELDGARLGGTNNGLLRVAQHATASEIMNLSFSFITADLTAASHTFKLQWRQVTTAHSATLRGADPFLLFAVAELYA